MPHSNYRAMHSKPPALLAAAGSAVALLILVTAMFWSPAKQNRAVPGAAEMSLAPAAALPAVAAASEPAARSTLVYRYSVIPGGVYSAAELVEAMERDPVVRAHYADFNAAAAKAIKVEKSRMVHVSYRVGDQIFWTKKKVRLAEGEVLLSDGEHLVRARCGNRIADVAGMTQENDPATEELALTFTSAEDNLEQSSNALVSMADAGEGEGNRASGGGATFGSNWPFGSGIAGPAPLWGAEGNPGHTGAPIYFMPGAVNTPGANPGGTEPGPNPPAPAANVPSNPGPDAGSPPAGPGPEVPNVPNVPNLPNLPNVPDVPNVPPVTPNPPVNTPVTPVIDEITPETLTPDTPLVFAPPTTTDEPRVPVDPNGPKDGAPLPEPGSAALFGLAAAALMLARRKSRKSRQ